MAEDKDLVKYSVTDEAIAQYRKEFLPLTIKGLDDHEGYEKVKNARIFIKGERVNVEKKRVELKEKSLTYGRAVDAEAKRITTAIEEVEDHLMAEQKKVDDENARIKFEKEQQDKLPERVAKLSELGVTESDVPESLLLQLNDTGFAELLNTLTAEKLEKQRLAQEETERRQREVQELIEMEKERIEREERHKAEIEEAKKKAAEDARIHAEIDAKRKEDERIAQEAAAKAEAERIEAEKPDNEKLKAFADSLGGIRFPEVTSKKAQAKVERVKKLFVQIVLELQAA